MVPDPFPKHPTTEWGAFKFHLGWGVTMGLLHVLGGLAMMWWHGVGAERHWRDRER